MHLLSCLEHTLRNSPAESVCMKYVFLCALVCIMTTVQTFFYYYWQLWFHNELLTSMELYIKQNVDYNGKKSSLDYSNVLEIKKNMTNSLKASLWNQK